MRGLQHVAVAVDGSSPAERALKTACDLSSLAHAALTIVAVVPPHHSFTPEGRIVSETDVEDRRFFQELLRRYHETATRAGVRPVTTAMPEGPVVEQLLSFIDEHRPDLIVVGARGLSTTRRILVGSVSDAIVHHAHCSVLVVRPTTSTRSTPGEAPSS